MKKICLIIGLLVLLTAGCSVAPVLGGKVEPGTLKDGTYEGSSKHSMNKAKVLLTVTDGKITELQVTKLVGTRKKSKVKETIPKLIIEQQSTDVDAISGATNISAVLMNAAWDAVQKASAK
jgi:uncharacterized protein with FMN-binding domain